MKKEDSQKEKNAAKNTTIFLFTFYSIILIFIFLLQNIQYLTFLSGIATLGALSFLIWVFITAYRGKILPEIRTLTVSIGFVLALFFNILFSVLVGLVSDVQLSNVILPDLSSLSGGIILYTTEGGNLVATIIILIGFL